MVKRVYKSDVAKLLEEGKQLIKSQPNGKFIHKVGIVNLVLSGIPVSTISKYVSESVNTITLWVKKVDEHGFNSLIPGKHSGRPPKLTKVQLEELKQCLQKDPGEYNYRVWDGPALSAFVKQKYQIDMSVRQCQRLFHNLGFSLQRPQIFPNQNSDSPERKEFKKNSTR